ncbi:MAG: bifunctional diaminohydroxyphosphoribosylaminopyrimidine deaminase/5-amino-6-(5-phosphoribosylamino)uracil reductase RibD [Paracoccaceae bacterium]
MTHALGLAARGLGTVWPNPAVGCVIVQGTRVVGRGWTQPGGRPHAEAMALTQAGPLAKGATAYVTLEPCSHHGKTPPCAEALIAYGIARVVTAITDPDPRVAGRGHAMLRAAGIIVTEAILAAEAARLNAGFLKRVTQGLPMVTLKLATTLDGRIATATGESRWITGPQARRATHMLRLTHDAVMVGAGTARADNPDLTARDLGASHQPIRILLDPRLTHSPQSRLAQTAQNSPVWLLHATAAPTPARESWIATGAHLIETPATPSGQIDLPAALTQLAAKGLTRILCEGGGTLAASLIRASLVDDLITYTAGAIIGSEGHPALGALHLATLSSAPRLRLLSTRRIGQDTETHWSRT